MKKTDRDILLSLIASLTLAEHMGEVEEDVEQTLKQMGLGDVIKKAHKHDDGFSYGVRKELGKMKVKTVWGTSIGDDDEDE